MNVGNYNENKADFLELCYFSNAMGFKTRVDLDEVDSVIKQVVALDAQNIIAVSCGEAHTLALNDKGQVYAWGLDSDGQLGLLGSEECIRVPSCLPKIMSIDSLVRTCSGLSFGRIRSGGSIRNIKCLSDIQIVQVACGYYHSLALSKASEVFSWGQNKYGQLGLGTDCKKQASPQLIKSLLGIPFMQVAAGGAHSFVLTLSGAIFGWGRNKFGQLGLNDENDRYVPNLLKSLRTQKIVYICCGEDHTAALTKEGGVFTFGAGGYGQLGHNSTSHEINPRKVFELMGSIVTQIACGRQHTSAFVPSSGRIYSFGLGGNGQLGTGSTSNRKSPFTVKGNWCPYNGQCPPDVDSEEYFCVKRIFSGGDQSFSHYSNPQNGGPPDDFRCPDPSKQIWTVSEALIQKWLSYPSGRFPVEIANEIDGTFSSSGCLNGSFLAVSNDDHYRTGTRFSGVDMNAARLLFHKLIQPDYPQIAQQVAASLEKNLIPKLTSSLPDVEALRFYLTLPECPLMSDSNNFTTIAIPFGTALVNLEKAPLKVLENWWSVLEPPLFLKIVELFKEVVVHLLKLYKIGIPPSERRIFNSFLHTALKVLEILHRGHCFTRIQGPTASPGPGARLTRLQGPAASPGPGAQGSPGSRGPRPRPDPGPRAHPAPGARGLARTRGPGLTRLQGPAASPRPGAQGSPGSRGPPAASPRPGAQGSPGSRGPPAASPRPGAQGSPGSRGPRPRPDPGPRAHPAPGARGLARTRGPGLTRLQGPAASPRPGAQGSPGSRGPRPRPDPGFSLTRTQGRTASSGPRIQLHPDPGAHGLARTQGHVASPGPGAQPHPDPVPSLTQTQGHAASPGSGTQRGFVFLIPIPVGQFPLSNSFGHFLRVPGQPPQNSLGGGLGEAPVCPVRGGGLVRGGCVGPWVCSGGRSPSVRTWPLPGC
ncbi:hypothetical protein QTO34_006103 [Cnephaeus nilssonii]|uniref:RCC1-like domain-containing protein n=1 Tax=Cnephaeus nilssonii TaxID=3371016 RepID=A0AA40HM09_CNENI|nr:hypothetical protein QTO34_006103 [Eptesicus nilssonii]